MMADLPKSFGTRIRNDFTELGLKPGSRPLSGTQTGGRSIDRRLTNTLLPQTGEGKHPIGQLTSRAMSW